MKVTINLYNQWKELSKDYNWHTINLINIEYEWDRVGHDGHIDLSLLGFSLYIHFLNDKYWKEIFK